MKHVPPSVREVAFNCPHCGALAAQCWYYLKVGRYDREHAIPYIADTSGAHKLAMSLAEDIHERELWTGWAEVMVKGHPFFWNGAFEDSSSDLCNVSVSECFSCRALSIWIYNRLVHPSVGGAPPANSDLPEDIRLDYDEASIILDQSPRGAAALLRLAIQKLCKELGQSGKNINADIAALVADGLDPRVQKALDAVRVIGNNAVHPGQIDLRDDRATAAMLFGLLNIIAEKLISVPKHIDEVYAALPEAARDAIDKRDGQS